ncbi:MAG TPA: hypothetical protein PKA82_01605 [Pyrinomonadaceae bacterium]|nr:hypothetical protein [Pyrinomonadaceae bacterium]
MRGFVVFIVAITVGLLCVFGFSSDDDSQVETFPLLNTDLVLEVRKKHAHPFLAEYDFKLVLRSGKTELDHANMTGDTGGLSRIEVFKNNETTFAFRDHAKTVCLNIDSERFKECDSVSLGKQIGFFDFDSERNWRFVSRQKEEKQ